MKKTKPKFMVGASVIVLLGAYGLGLLIRNIRYHLAQTNPQNQVTTFVQQNGIEANEPMPVKSRDIEYVVEQEPLEEFFNEPEETAEELWDVEPEDQRAQDEIPSEEDFRNRQFGGGMQWNSGQQWFDWANNLTEEQRARLERGMILMWQRWQNFSEEEAQAERFRMMEMGQRWWNMTDTERQQAMQRMQEQFQQWLKSDQEELPEFTFD